MNEKLRFFVVVGSLSIITAMVLVSLASLGSAELGYFCTNGNTTSFYNWTTDGDVHSIETPCLHGCVDGACQSDASEGDFPMAMILAYIAIAAIMAYFAMNIDREQHGHLQILLMFLSLYSAFSAVVGLQVMVDLQGIPNVGYINDTMITVFSWVSWFIMGYVILIFIYSLIMALQDQVAQRKAKQRGGLSPLRPT